MGNSYHGFRLVLEVISFIILYSILVIPMVIAAFMVSPFMGVPFLCVLILGVVKRTKYQICYN